MRSVLARPSAAFVRRAPRAFSTSTHKADTHATSRIQSIQESFYETVDRVDVHVPAATANMGPGFDSLGLAMNVYNRLVVTRADKFSMTIEGEGADRIKPSPDNLIVKCVEKGLAAVGQPMVPLHFECQRLGAADARDGELLGRPRLGPRRRPRPRRQGPVDAGDEKLLLQLAADEEGHPDNVAPAIYGGFQVAFRTACPGQWVTQRVNIPTGLQCVLFIPDDEMKTSEARGCLPENPRAPRAQFLAQFSARHSRPRNSPTSASSHLSGTPTPSTTSLARRCSSTASPRRSSTRCATRWKTSSTSPTESTCSRTTRSSRRRSRRVRRATRHKFTPCSSPPAAPRSPPPRASRRRRARRVPLRAPAPPSSRSPAASAPRASAPTRCRSSSPRRSRRR